MFEKFTSAVAGFLAASEPLQSSISDAPEPNFTYPGDNCCIIYGAYDFNTNEGYITMCAYGEYTIRLGDYGFDDVNSSWSCGKNVWADFCTEPNCDDARGEHIQRTAGNTRNGHSGRNDWFSEVRMHLYNPDVLGAVTVFGWMEYTQDDMWERGAPNDQIESVMVPFGTSVEFYENNLWGGKMESVRGGPYTDGNRQMRCVNLGELRSRVSSLKVYKDYMLGPAQGYWESITHSGTIEFTYHIGMDYSKSTLDSSTQQYAINYSMEWGFEFAGASEKQSISAGFTETIQHDTQETYGYNISQDVKISCNDGGDDSRVGLWQWVSSTNDKKSALFSKHTICRYGENWTTQPACPWNACADSQCTYCVDGWKA